MFALLIPLVLSLAPQLAGMIFGSKGADATAKVAGVVQTVVGAVADLSAPGGVAAAVAHIQSNQQASADLAAKLADLHLQMQKEQDAEAEALRQDALDELKARLADTSSARDMAVEPRAGAQRAGIWQRRRLGGDCRRLRVGDLLCPDQPPQHFRRPVRFSSGRHPRRDGHPGCELLARFQLGQCDEKHAAGERSGQPGEQRAVKSNEDQKIAPPDWRPPLLSAHRSPEGANVRSPVDAA